LTLSVKKFFTILEEHSDELNEEILKQLPEKIANPLVIIKSKSVPNSIVMIIDLDNEYGHKLVVPISLQNDHPEVDILGVNRAASINISTIYGGDNNYPKEIILLKQAFNSKEIIFIDYDAKNYATLKHIFKEIVKYSVSDLYDYKNNDAKAFSQKKVVQQNVSNNKT
jgi:hypothetical protein